MAKKVAIIGSGASGLTGIKCCVDEGLEPVCFERTGIIGGLWHYTNNVQEHQACVMKTTVINTSKEMMCYSDFPIPADFPNFMHNTKVLEYFNLYIDKFDLKKYIRFYTEILSVKQAADFESTGRWDLEVRDLKDEKKGVWTETYDAILICTGHHAEKRVPNFVGSDKFKGEIVHTHDYRDHKGYEDKRVVVIGIGNSGGDVAVELSRIASQVYLSTRRGTWVINRIESEGSPADMFATRRVMEGLKSVFGQNMFNNEAEKRVNKRFDHALYGLKPKHRFNGQHPMVNDELPNRIACGSVTIKPDIKQFLETGVEFVDGTVEKDIDVIILATGYKFGFPFIDKKVIDVKDNVVELFKYVYPPDLKPCTLAVIGCIQPWGAIMPLSELQCRWAARVFKGVTHLPSKDEMWQDIRCKQQAMEDRYVASPRHTIQVDWIPYMDELAEQFGAKPDFTKLWLSDPKLAARMYFGPCTPYQYRIHGPVPWKGARDAILTTWDRVNKPFQTRPVESTQQGSGMKLLMKVIAVIVLAILVKFLLF